jgi:hypothetical protein
MRSGGRGRRQPRIRSRADIDHKSGRQSPTYDDYGDGIDHIVNTDSGTEDAGVSQVTFISEFESADKEPKGVSMIHGDEGSSGGAGALPQRMAKPVVPKSRKASADGKLSAAEKLKLKLRQSLESQSND